MLSVKILRLKINNFYDGLASSLNILYFGMCVRKINMTICNGRTNNVLKKFQVCTPYTDIIISLCVHYDERYVVKLVFNR